MWFRPTTHKQLCQRQLSPSNRHCKWRMLKYDKNRNCAKFEMKEEHMQCLGSGVWSMQWGSERSSFICTELNLDPAFALGLFLCYWPRKAVEMKKKHSHRETYRNVNWIGNQCRPTTTCTVSKKLCLVWSFINAHTRSHFFILL